MGRKALVTRIGQVCIEAKSVLAPLAGITNTPFRLLAREMGAGAVFTEMISADGLVRGNSKTHRYLMFEEAERPIGLQIFGSNPEIMSEAARIAAERKPDLIDINLGCPVKKVVQRNAGAALLRDPELVGRIVQAVVQAVPLPVIAKIRSGWSQQTVNAVPIAKLIEDAGAAGVTIHPRTRSAGFSGKADWQVIRQVKAAVRIPVIGNGDVASAADAKHMLDETGCDLVMIGRAAFGYPWIFREIETFLSSGHQLPSPDVHERMELCLRHLRGLAKQMGEVAAVHEMRKHIAAYTKGMKGSGGLRKEVFGLDSAKEVETRLERFAARTELVAGTRAMVAELSLAEWERVTG